MNPPWSTRKSGFANLFISKRLNLSRFLQPYLPNLCSTARYCTKMFYSTQLGQGPFKQYVTQQGRGVVLYCNSLLNITIQYNPCPPKFHQIAQKGEGQGVGKNVMGQCHGTILLVISLIKVNLSKGSQTQTGLRAALGQFKSLPATLGLKRGSAGRISSKEGSSSIYCNNFNKLLVKNAFKII